MHAIQAFYFCVPVLEASLNMINNDKMQLCRNAGTTMRGRHNPGALDGDRSEKEMAI